MNHHVFCRGMRFVDTHAHVDGEEFAADRDEMLRRAEEQGVAAILVPAIDLKTSNDVLRLCALHPGYLYPMVGLHPEEVRADWQDQLSRIRELLPSLGETEKGGVAIGEVGLDYYIIILTILSTNYHL